MTDEAEKTVDDDTVANTPLAAERAVGGAALLVIDMISDWQFPDAGKLLPQAAAIAPRIATLADRCRRAGVPVIYANDNHGRWRSDFREVVGAARRSEGAGAGIARLLEPRHEDYFVLKPKHSAFHSTPLDLLLRHLQVRRLILTGVSSDQCVLYTAADARMRDYEAIVPRDAVATQTEPRNAMALRHFADVLGLETPESAALEVPPAA